MTGIANASVEMSADAAVQLEERGPYDAAFQGYPKSTTLVATKANTGLSLIYDDDDDSDEDPRRAATVTLCLRAYHVENTETEKTYHASVELELTWTQVRQIASGLQFMLSLRPDA